MIQAQVLAHEELSEVQKDLFKSKQELIQSQ
jgi:hypothetical protein